ncbi:exodeoxyribonuclease VII small subunit [Amylibacter kogurei]|uniref:Exodeoxyribonuclease 7 small subunit n=1 Tax=Paramylibacter kogurei TaxID=1889778 RepID=A0A2G5KAN7_9RHOB|nr:exodeoxyribonuclease VII small subunit [Amylibacter kogurei]PIB26505.1 exodeoxyribonuclease VII small subunit [Amylibacter kogurei]
MTQTPVAEMSFEQAMQELETLVTQLEGSQVALDDSIKLYERGAELKKHCEEKLKSAEEKVAKITFGADGKPNGLTAADE